MERGHKLIKIWIVNLFSLYLLIYSSIYWYKLKWNVYKKYSKKVIIISFNVFMIINIIEYWIECIIPYII